MSRPTIIKDDDTRNIFCRRQRNKLFSRNNNNYAGANRSSDDEYEQERAESQGEDEHDEFEGNNDDDEQGQKQVKRKDSGQIYSQSSMQSSMICDVFSTTIPSSTFIDTSVRSNPNNSTVLMMMKGNGSFGSGGNSGRIQHQFPTPKTEQTSHEHRTVVGSSSVRPTSSSSSSSSSSLPVDEQHLREQEQERQHLKPRGYNFVPAPFNGTRLITKSSEQLNRSFANDSLVKYCTPSTTSSTSSTQTTTKDNSSTSILKQNYLKKYTQPSNIQSSSKNKQKNIKERKRFSMHESSN